MTDRKLPSFHEAMRTVSPTLLGAVFGVAWNVERGRIMFFSGNYDLDRDDAMKDFAQRVERMTKNPEPGGGMGQFEPLGPDEAELDADLNAEGEAAAREEEV